MASTLTIPGCTVTNDSITLSFSEPVDHTSPSGATSATNRLNYTIYDPPAHYALGTNPPIPAGQPITVSADGTTVTIPLSNPFNDGDFVLIEVSNIALASLPGTSALVDEPVSISIRVPGVGSAAQATKDVEDAISYPILTEEIGYRPSPVGIPITGGGGSSGGPTSLGQVALKAVSDVLGWKANPGDPKGFVGALTQSFTLSDVEGHVESKWTPRTYAVQTDLGGGITGAQASLYLRAKDALDKTLPLLDGLYPLDPEADPEYVKALREMARSQMTEIIKEMGTVGLPSILRIDTYFRILVGQSELPIRFDPDQVRGTLGQLRDTYGIFFRNNKLSNSVEDEQDITNFRVISDYMTSLLQSWISNRDFFRLGTTQPAFFGTQLVLISRQFNVITETVNEVRFALDSVFIGPSERQTLLLEFADGSAPMFLEDVLNEVESFATDEGPRLLRDGGRISVTNNLLPVVVSQQNLVEQAHAPINLSQLPDGFKTARVLRALDDLQDQLTSLVTLIQQVEQQVPPPEDKLTIASVTIPEAVLDDSGDYVFSVFGDGFEVGVGVTMHSTDTLSVAESDVLFYSAQRIDVTIHPTWSGFQESGSHDVTVTNPDGTSVTLVGAFNYDPGSGEFGAPVKRCPLIRKAPVANTGTRRPSTKRRKVEVTAGGGGGAKAPYRPPATSRPPSAEVAALHNRIDVLQKSHEKSHETLLQRIEGLGARMAEFFEGKPKKGKDKDD